MDLAQFIYNHGIRVTLEPVTPEQIPKPHLEALELSGIPEGYRFEYCAIDGLGERIDEYITIPSDLPFSPTDAFALLMIGVVDLEPSFEAWRGGYEVPDTAAARWAYAQMLRQHQQLTAALGRAFATCAALAFAHLQRAATAAEDAAGAPAFTTERYNLKGPQR
jgi:hypothetical protein